MAPTRNLRIASIFGTLTASFFGYTVGSIGGLIVLPSFLRHFELKSLPPTALAAAQSQIVTVWLVGALFGVPVGIPVCAIWGRRACLALCAGLYFFGAILQLIGSGLLMFDIGRAINGLGVGAGTLVGPMYISEVSTPEDRGILVSSYQVILQIAALIGFWTAFALDAIFSDGSDLQWQVSVMIQLIPGALLLLGSTFIPETPQYLARRQDWTAVTASLVWLRQLPEDDSEILKEMQHVRVTAELRVAVVQEQKQVGFLKEAVTKPMRRRLHVGIGLMIVQNIVGLNALNYYAPVIFKSAGFESVASQLFLTGLFGVSKLISAIAYMFIFVNIRGNRFWLRFGSAICGTSMLVLAYFVRQLNDPSYVLTEGPNLGGIISVLMVYLFAFSFSVSIGPIPWNVCSEIFPLHLNTKCCAITTFTQWLFQIVIAGILTPRLIVWVDWVTYIIFAVGCLLSLAWVTLFVPETKGVPLGRSMDELFISSSDKGPAQEDGEVEGIAEDIDERTALLSHRR